MENLKSLLEDYLRLAWPPFVVGIVVGALFFGWLI